MEKQLIEFFCRKSNRNHEPALFINVQVKFERTLQPNPCNFVHIEKTGANRVAFGGERTTAFEFFVKYLFAFWPGKRIKETFCIEVFLFCVLVENIDWIILVVAVFFILAVFGQDESILFGQFGRWRIIVDVFQ